MYKRKHKKRETGTEFEEAWGIHADDLAFTEGVTVDAIRMRVMKWGNPFQRRANMSMYEKKYGKTQAQLALELGVHPITIASRERTHGNAYYCNQVTTSRWNFGQVTNDRKQHWSESDNWQFTLKSTYFTLEDALEKLDKQNAANKDMGNDL
jgi:hypothetical protein